MPFTFRQGDLPKLDLQVDRGTDFSAWQAQWESYLSLSELDKEPQARQVQALTLCFSRETLTIVNNLGLTVEQKKDIKSIVKAIQQYVEGHINESVERRNFRRRVQQPGESFDDYLVSLRELIKTCNFCSDECIQKNLRDQIIEGLIEGDTVEVLLQETDLTLSKAIAKCRGQEAAKKQRSEMTSHNHEATMGIQKVYQDKRGHTPTQTCPGCGESTHQGGRRQCPAFSQTCHSCQKAGHFAKVCRGKPARQSGLQPNTQPQASARAIHVKSPTQMGSPRIFMSNIGATAATDPAPTITMHISSLNGSADMEVLPDSGADISAAGKEILGHLGEYVDNLLPSTIIPKAVNGTRMQPIGKIALTLQLGNKTHTEDVHIYPSVSGMLISWRAAKSLGILPKCYPHPMDSAVTPMTAEHPSVNATESTKVSQIPTRNDDGIPNCL